MNKRTMLMLCLIACLIWEIGCCIPVIPACADYYTGKDTFELGHFLVSLNQDGTYRVEEYGCDPGSTTMVFPSVLNGIPVTSIGRHVLYDWRDLKSIVISEGIKSVDPYMIGGDMPMDPDTIKIPSSLTDIAEGAFQDIDQVIVPENHPVYVLRNGQLIDKRDYTLLHYDQTRNSATIDSCVKRIGDYCFAIDYDHLTEIWLPQGLESIGKFAFWGCDSLKSMVIPNGTKLIESSAFESCNNLKEVTVPASVTQIGEWAFDRGVTIIAPEGSAAERFARANGNPWIDSKGFTPKGTGGRPSGLSIVRTGLAEFDENNEYKGRRGTHASRSDLPYGHHYGFFIEFKNNASYTISFEVELFSAGVYWEPYEIRLQPGNTYSLRCWSYNELPVGTHNAAWYIGGSREIEKTVTITY